MSDIVMSSALTLRRNYRDLRFLSEPQKAFEWVREALDAAGVVYEPIEEDGAAQALSVGGNCVLRVGGEEDTLVLSAPVHEDGADKAADELEALAEKLFFRHPAARMDGIGYLTRRPVLAGSGLQLRAVMHLHTLAHLKQIDATAREALRRWDCTLVKEGDDCPEGSDLYALCNRRTFNKDAWKAVFDAAAALDEKEKLLSGKIIAYPTSLMIDRAHRAYGLMRHARKMEWQEFCALWSSLRFGAEHGILPLSVDFADDLMRAAQNPPDKLRENGLAAGIGYRRAETVREKIKEAEHADIREL